MKKTTLAKVKKNRYQIKTFFYDMTKKFPKDIDEEVNTFLSTADVKNPEDIHIEQTDTYIKIS